MIRTFGPSVSHDETTPDNLQVSCASTGMYCFLLHNRTCSDVKPPREIPDTRNTPDWCKYRAGVLQDVFDMRDLHKLGLPHRPRAWLSGVIKTLPVEYRGTNWKGQQRKLTEMKDVTMQHAILKAWRDGLWTPN